MRLTRLLPFFVFLSPSISAQQIQQEAPGIIIKGATLIDVHTGRQISDSLLVIEDGRITRVSESAEFVAPQGARVIDARGKWIIPGLMDMHVHTSTVSDFPWALFIANGVTTIRDPGGSVSVLRVARQEISPGTRLGPRLFFAGYILDGDPPLIPDLSIIADTPQRAESAVNFLIDQGADAIKVYNGITEPVLMTISRVAEAHGIPVIGHVPRSMTMRRAVELGMRGLEHIRVTGRELLPLEEANRIDFLPFVQREALLWQEFELESAEMKHLVTFLADSEVFLDPTLTVDEVASLSLHEEEKADPNNRFLPPEALDQWFGPLADFAKVPPELQETARAGFTKRLQFIKMCSQAGVQIITGTDGAGIGRRLPGLGLHHELELLAQAGLSPIQVLQAATINAARALRKEKELGSIEPGKWADIVILNSDPLTDVRNAADIDSVVVRGRWLDRKALDEVLTQLEAAGMRH